MTWQLLRQHLQYNDVKDYSFSCLTSNLCIASALSVLLLLVLTWISERPGSIHIAYVCCDADRQDAVYQGDKATVPLVTPATVNVTQDKVERGPKGQAQKRTNHKQCHLLFCKQNNQNKQLKTTDSFFQKLACQQSSRQLWITLHGERKMHRGTSCSVISLTVETDSFTVQRLGLCSPL